MPNYCLNFLTVENCDEAMRFIDEGKFKSFQALIPRPESEEENWYDWNCENWGTKWDMNEDEIVLTGDGTMMFQTAWSPSLPVTKALSEKFPNAKIYHTYEEGGCGFRGVAIFEDGIYTDYETDYYFKHDDLVGDEKAVEIIKKHFDVEFDCSDCCSNGNCKNTEHGWMCEECYDEYKDDDDDEWQDIESEKIEIRVNNY